MKATTFHRHPAAHGPEGQGWFQGSSPGWRGPRWTCPAPPSAPRRCGSPRTPRRGPRGWCAQWRAGWCRPAPPGSCRAWGRPLRRPHLRERQRWRELRRRPVPGRDGRAGAAPRGAGRVEAAARGPEGRAGSGAGSGAERVPGPQRSRRCHSEHRRAGATAAAIALTPHDVITARFSRPSTSPIGPAPPPHWTARLSIKASVPGCHGNEGGAGALRAGPGRPLTATETEQRQAVP